MADHWMILLVCAFALMNHVHADTSYNPNNHKLPNGQLINLTILQMAESKGAVCLNGDAPAYYFNGGYGDGASNWMIHLEGGGWCYGANDCNSWRLKMGKDDHAYMINGALNGDKLINPYFYNWNRIFVRYCDSGSYSGDVEEVDPNYRQYRRGARIFKAIVEDLLVRGMSKASNVILSGNSAGGLGVLLQCDNFRAMVPSAVSRVKCVADSAFFLHGQGLIGQELREQGFFSMSDYHGVTKALSKSCTSRMDPRLCIFPENFIGDIKTPVFLIEAIYDQYQIKNGTQLTLPQVNACYYNETCSPDETKAIQDFGTAMANTLQTSVPPSVGLFADSCKTHDQIFNSHYWNQQPLLDNKRMGQTVADWFWDQSAGHVIQKTNFPIRCGHLRL